MCEWKVLSGSEHASTAALPAYVCMLLVHLPLWCHQKSDKACLSVTAILSDQLQTAHNAVKQVQASAAISEATCVDIARSLRLVFPPEEAWKVHQGA